MKRRDFVRTTAAGTAGLMLGRCSTRSAHREGREPPNIVFIMTDQQHSGMMSCAGNPWLRTPAMDRLAASGVRFELTQACNPVCLPSRFSLLSGRMPSAVGIGDNSDGKAQIPEEIRLNTMGWLFRNAGYETVYGGKTHVPDGIAVVHNGWDYLDPDPRDGLADTCADFVRQPHERPFLLFASFINPHDICYMAINDHLRAKGKSIHDNLASKTVEGLLEGPRQGNVGRFVEEHCPPLPDNYEIPLLEPECIKTRYVPPGSFRAFVRERWGEYEWRLHRWAYCRLTEIVDAEIGRLVDAIDEAGLAGDTLVVFTSDHGDLDGAHRMEHKNVLYEESVRVPLILRRPGTVSHGVVDREHLVSNGLDLLPTLCDYAGIPVPQGLEGRSLRPLADGTGARTWRDSVVVESRNGRMLRTARYKYCIYDEGRNREQLTDLESDPGEMHNLAADPAFAAVRTDHRRRLREWVERTGDRGALPYLHPDA